MEEERQVRDGIKERIEEVEGLSIKRRESILILLLLSVTPYRHRFCLIYQNNRLLSWVSIILL